MEFQHSISTNPISVSTTRHLKKFHCATQPLRVIKLHPTMLILHSPLLWIIPIKMAFTPRLWCSIHHSIISVWGQALNMHEIICKMLGLSIITSAHDTTVIILDIQTIGTSPCKDKVFRLLTNLVYWFSPKCTTAASTPIHSQSSNWKCVAGNKITT